MQWHEIRERFPDKWVVVEAIEVHLDGDRRYLDELSLIGVSDESPGAVQEYKRLHQRWPQREYYVFSTQRETLEVRERFWAGIRAAP
jgi:hypothetical protein